MATGTMSSASPCHSRTGTSDLLQANGPGPHQEQQLVRDALAALAEGLAQAGLKAAATSRAAAASAIPGAASARARSKMRPGAGGTARRPDQSPRASAGRSRTRSTSRERGDAGRSPSSARARRHPADDPGAADAFGQAPGAGGGVRPAARDADHREAGDPSASASSRTSSGQSAIARPGRRVDRPWPGRSGAMIRMPRASAGRCATRTCSRAPGLPWNTSTGRAARLGAIFGVAEGAAVAQTKRQVLGSDAVQVRSRCASRPLHAGARSRSAQPRWRGRSRVDARAVRGVAARVRSIDFAHDELQHDSSKCDCAPAAGRDVQRAAVTRDLRPRGAVPR